MNLHCKAWTVTSTTKCCKSAQVPKLHSKTGNFWIPVPSVAPKNSEVVRIWRIWSADMRIWRICGYGGQSADMRLWSADMRIWRICGYEKERLFMSLSKTARCGYENQATKFNRSVDCGYENRVTKFNRSPDCGYENRATKIERTRNCRYEK